MKKHKLWLLLLLTTSCTFRSSPNDDQHKTEFALHKMRTDIEELKQDLNSNQIEMNILEGKILNQDSSLSSIKEKALDSQQERMDKFYQSISSLEKKIRQMETKQEKILDDIRELTRHANDTTTALTQYKTRISELENLICHQEDQIPPRSRSGISYKKYRVQKGDTLKKIAKASRTSPEDLIKLNQLPDDLIYVDQELLIPEK